MQEWVDTLRLKLREMKILSPKENLYSKLPEIRPPLLPTRDPTRDPLPATPPVPAAIVPGVERIVNTTQSSRTVASVAPVPAPSTSNGPAAAAAEPAASSAEGNARNQNRRNASPLRNPIENTRTDSVDDSFTVDLPNATPLSASTSNTLSQNLIKMLYPLPNFSHPPSDLVPNESESDESLVVDNPTTENTHDTKSDDKSDEVHSLARTFAANVLFDSNTKRNAASNSTAKSVPANRDLAEGK